MSGFNNFTCAKCGLTVWSIFEVDPPVCDTCHGTQPIKLKAYKPISEKKKKSTK